MLTRHASFTVPATPNSRNVHSFSGDGAYVGGTFLNIPLYITNEIFYDMGEHFIVFPRTNYDFRLHRLENDNTPGPHLERESTEELQPGRYIILGPQSQPVTKSLTPETPIRRAQSPTRASSPNETRSQKHFRYGVLARDTHCVLGARESAPMEGLVAAHIYPVSRLNDWIKDDCERWVETEDGEDKGISAADVAPRGMFSVKNGLLLSVAVHDAFCNFSFGVDVDHGYRAICFAEDTTDINGQALSPTTRNSHSGSRASDDYPRWHYHHAILTFMSGLGQRSWEYFDHGDLESLVEHEGAKEVLEVELGNWLHAFVNAD